MDYSDLLRVAPPYSHAAGIATLWRRRRTDAGADAGAETVFLHEAKMRCSASFFAIVQPAELSVKIANFARLTG